MLNYSDIVQACNQRTGSHHWTVQCLFSCLHHLRSHVLSKVCIPKLKSLVSLAMGIFAEHPFCPFFLCVCVPRTKEQAFWELNTAQGLMVNSLILKQATRFTGMRLDLLFIFANPAAQFLANDAYQYAVCATGFC